MSNQESAELLAVGEMSLADYETGMDAAIKRKNFDLAWCYLLQYDGAAYMLKDLGLLSFEEYSARCMNLLDRFYAARDPGYCPKESV